MLQLCFGNGVKWLPHKMNVVTHNNECIKFHLVFLYTKLQAFYYYILVFIVT